MNRRGFFLEGLWEYGAVVTKKNCKTASIELSGEVVKEVRMIGRKDLLQEFSLVEDDHVSVCNHTLCGRAFRSDQMGKRRYDGSAYFFNRTRYRSSVADVLSIVLFTKKRYLCV